MFDLLPELSEGLLKALGRGLGVLLIGNLCTLAAAQSLDEAHWPSWRGPLGTGEAPGATPPTRWSESENVRWKVPIPGRGNGTPILWGDLIFVLSALDVGQAPKLERSAEELASLKDAQRKTQISRQRFGVLALHRKDGSVAWKSVASVAEPHEEIHDDGTWASSSAVTDGDHLYAYFGSQGLYAYDLGGQKLWSRQFEPMSRRGFGEGSSPALYGDTLVIQRDHDGDSEILALDKNSGELLWRQPREERVTWATPLILEVDGKPQVITNGSQKIRAYNLATGELIWECAGMTPNAVPTPVHHDGLVYLTSGFGKSAMLAIRPSGAHGDIQDSEHVVWKLRRHTPYVPTPLVVGDQIYFLKSNSGMLSAANLKTGELSLKAERLAEIQNIYASPVAAAGHVYVVGRDGQTEVYAQGKMKEPVAINLLEDRPFAASPALAEGELYLRGEHFLYCIAAD